MPLVRFWRVHFLGAELAVAAIATTALGVWIEHLHGKRALGPFLDSQRAAVYGTLATSDAALLGFIIATAAIVLGFAQDERFALLRASRHYPTLWRVFTSTIRFLALATVGAIAALLTDHDTSPCWPATIACAGTTMAAALRLARSIWALEHVITIVTGTRERAVDESAS